LSLIVSSGNVETPAVPGQVQGALSSDKSELSVGDKRGVSPADTSPAPSAPSISHDGESGGTTLSMLFHPLPVTGSSGNADNLPIPDHVREPVKSSTHALDPGAASEDTLSRASTAPTTPNVVLREVAESSNAYPPLKSVARCLCIILDNCKVRSTSHTLNLKYSQLYQQMEVTELVIKSLAPRIKTLSKSLCTPIPVDDVNERERENELEQYVQTL
jgi:hypothetical protein